MRLPVSGSPVEGGVSGVLCRMRRPFHLVLTCTDQRLVTSGGSEPEPWLAGECESPTLDATPTLPLRPPISANREMVQQSRS
jgi:hypothetical protein